MLADEGAKATVKASLTSDVGPKKITAMNFTITSPPVRIGPIQLAGVSPVMLAKVNTLVEGQTGNEFDTENTAIGLQHAFEDLYQDQGYAAVKVDVGQLDPRVISGQGSDIAIEIPFSVAITEGGVYKLGTINYPADAVASRAEVGKFLAKYQAGSGRPLDQFLLAVNDAYHARGYLDCSVVSHASFNEATHIVNYSVEIDPGPLYKMGAVQFDGAPDAMAIKLKNAWKLARVTMGEPSGPDRDCFMHVNRLAWMRFSTRPRSQFNARSISGPRKKSLSCGIRNRKICSQASDRGAPVSR